MLAMIVAPFGIDIPSYTSSLIVAWGTPIGAMGLQLQRKSIKKMIPHKHKNAPVDLFDHRRQILQLTFIREGREPQRSHDCINLSLSFSCNLGMQKQCNYAPS